MVRRCCLLKPELGSFFVALLVCAGCKAGEGARCFDDDECGGSLTCCKVSNTPKTAGSCLAQCTIGLMDAARDGDDRDTSSDTSVGDANTDTDTGEDVAADVQEDVSVDAEADTPSDITMDVNAVDTGDDGAGDA